MTCIGQSMIQIPIEQLMPHRGRMKLIDEIIYADEGMAVSSSRVTNQWPLQDGLYVSSLILIELIAQTSAITIGWKRMRDDHSAKGTGWLVGIRSARFQLDNIPVHSQITTQSVIMSSMDNYTELHGHSSIGDMRIGEALLQVMRTGGEDDNESST